MIKTDEKTVAQYMVHSTTTIHQDAAVSQAVQLLLKSGLPGCAVVDDKRKVVGFVSEQDCLKHMLEGRYHQSESKLVREVMSQPVLSVDPNMDIAELAQMMAGPKPTIYPVIERGKLLGEIRRNDVLRALFEAH